MDQAIMFNWWKNFKEWSVITYIVWLLEQIFKLSRPKQQVENSLDKNPYTNKWSIQFQSIHNPVESPLSLVDKGITSNWQSIQTWSENSRVSRRLVSCKGKASPIRKTKKKKEGQLATWPITQYCVVQID